MSICIEADAGRLSESPLKPCWLDHDFCGREAGNEKPVLATISIVGPAGAVIGPMPLGCLVWLSGVITSAMTHGRREKTEGRCSEVYANAGNVTSLTLK